MAEEYYKEIEVSNWKAIALIILSIILVLTLLIAPNYTAIDTYEYETHETEELYSILLTENTTITNRDFTRDENGIHSTTNLARGYAIINDHNKTIIAPNTTLTMKFRNIIAGAGDMLLTFINTTYGVNTMSLDISIEDQSTLGTVSLIINDIAIGTKQIDMYEFRANPVINITAYGDKWVIHIGGAEFNISEEAYIYGDLPYIPANELRVSGTNFYWNGLTNLTLHKVNTIKHTEPLVKDWMYLFLLVIVAGVSVFALYY